MDKVTQVPVREFGKLTVHDADGNVVDPAEVVGVLVPHWTPRFNDATMGLKATLMDALMRGTGVRVWADPTPFRQRLESVWAHGRTQIVHSVELEYSDGTNLYGGLVLSIRKGDEGGFTAEWSIDT